MPTQRGGTFDRNERSRRGRHKTFYSILRRMEELEKEREELDRKHRKRSNDQEAIHQEDRSMTETKILPAASEQTQRNDAKKKKEEDLKAKADKEKRQEEARQKEAEHAAKQAEERAQLRERAEELRKTLESEDIEDEERSQIGTELMKIEALISG